MRRHAIILSLFGLSQATPFFVYNTMKGGDVARRRTYQTRIIPEDAEDKITEVVRVSYSEIETQRVKTRVSTETNPGDYNWMNRASSKSYGHYIW
ncbi:hypothetical protein FisN_29Hu066 [Fistulifera solaris]|uniref:Uncharacterized protein n=1 Tax=Fistulifera solaris TaxID=1519565 RepID=A0A1Z5K5Y1_FISSO|nr:hypothetical protein FisN_29Hu066 [Fistulifera solaris]|eukprot:GAX21629.1 hypothetical protein FisN_29Hu066 [Fistulifera solaris]